MAGETQDGNVGGSLRHGSMRLTALNDYAAFLNASSLADTNDSINPDVALRGRVTPRTRTRDSVPLKSEARREEDLVLGQANCGEKIKLKVSRR